ncbi:Thiol:disulfide interchange protein DsbA precursor [Leminorella richardii]|uniref:Thiol:disulfide interchange protein n=2 Tax=Leminorella richardii TaxID=158841 RepID=A0A2X4VBN0_9GAMM|nr:thiol:disulfide interchange protein DsbA [Leminorella richardii]SQI44182.1 Thiol:disulfide interchange protein DsbA precursor [Leminorella richardii]
MKKMVCAAIAAGAFLVLANPIVTASAAETSAVVANYKDGKQYTTLSREATEEPQVMEFFSFFCPHCYDFENVYHMTDVFKKQLPENGKMVKYHVDFMGGELGSQLTQAWAVAITLGVQQKVAPLLFEGIQKTRTIQNLEGIRQAFIQAGVTAEEFDSAWNSFIVKSLTAQQRKLAADVELRSVPSVVVNGKYMVKTEGLEADSIESFIKEYGQVVKFLLGKK